MFQNSCSCFKNMWLLFISILLILSGIYVLFNPLTALITSVILIGIVLITIGCGYILSFQENDSYAILALGILDVFVGLFFLTNIGITALSFPIIWGFWILFNSTIQLVMGLELKNQDKNLFKALVSTSVFGLIFATLIFIYPAVATITITVLLGLYLIGYGIFEFSRFIACIKQKSAQEA